MNSSAVESLSIIGGKDRSGGGMEWCLFSNDSSGEGEPRKK